MTESVRIVALSHAEARVIRELMDGGADNPTIARRLFLTTYTVKSHMKHVLKKAHCRNRTDLAIRIALRQIVLTVPLEPASHGYEAILVS